MNYFNSITVDYFTDCVAIINYIAIIDSEVVGRVINNFSIDLLATNVINLPLFGISKDISSYLSHPSIQGTGLDYGLLPL